MLKVVTISKENLKTELPDFDYCNCFIAGGAIRDSIVGKEYSDIDIFGTLENLDAFRDKNLSEWKEGIKSKTGDDSYIDSSLRNFYKDGIKVQLIFKEETQEMYRCLDQFDYTICQFGFDGKDVYCNPESIIHLYEKKLVIHALPFPYDSMRRMQKYIKKGYSICNGGLKEIGDAIRKMSDEDYKNQLEFYNNGHPRFVRFD